jgi:hypothetical protein
MQGGLGNQLFQLAAGLYAEEQLSTSVLYETSWYKYRPNAAERPFGIAPLLSHQRLVTLPLHVARYAYSTYNPFYRAEPQPEQDNTAESIFQLLARNWRVLSGYFQSASLVMAVRDQLSERLTPLIKEKTSGECADVIGVHIRLGDYYETPKVMESAGVCSPEYFSEALELVNKRRSVPQRIVVFTDSPEIFAKDYASSFPANAYISEARSGWQALAGLSQCEAVIMSNSSLSWWAAFVGAVLTGQVQQVVMPTPWMAVPSEIEGRLVMEGWQMLKRKPLTTPS